MAICQSFRLSEVKSGVVWAIVASLATAATHAAMRGIDLHPFLIAFWRNLFCLILILPITVPRKAWRTTPGAASRHVWRGLANTIAMIMLIAGLTRIPFAEATALTFAAPIFVAIGGVLILRESPTRLTIAAAVLGFVGVLIVAPPDAGWLGSGGALVIGSAVFFAASMLIGRSQTRYADTLSILFYLYVLLTLFSAPLAAAVWRLPDAASAAQLTLVAVCAVFAHGAAMASLRRAEASTVAPYDYLRLVWVVPVGLLLFEEGSPSTGLIIGGALIICAALLPTISNRAG